MAKTQLTIEIDEELAKTVKAAATPHDTDSTIIERALISYFSLRNTVNRIHSQLGDEELSEEEADALAVAEVRAVRAEHERAKGR